MEYLPASVNSYINKTWEEGLSRAGEGRDLAYDLYDDIKEEVLSKSDVHVDAMTEMMERFFERANEIHSLNKRELSLTRRSRRSLTRRVCSSCARSSTTWRRSWRGRPSRMTTCPRGSRGCSRA